ncbi:Hpt domain-containing protein [Mesorhizobium sp. LHD-90]|uniref:Hpt domain-containing protein n=1 Tax=Mesorhizobium sp. LHD-90 TaxID=3071414 RepID=UPI0027DF8EB9|nr:Hpt domain-containing protein [Mesorhizobium sp. LHD-90]MDQ6437834.1 Hpt domain-containing protein [Mesorhizobium sp. LHD-90]
MLENKDKAVAYSMPGGETSGMARHRPIDMAHLARQTMGDRALEQEVLGMFVNQSRLVQDQIAHAGPEECQRLAHGLRGAAAGVGAFAIADCASEIEADPRDAQAKRKLAKLIEEARDFVAAICR